MFVNLYKSRQVARPMLICNSEFAHVTFKSQLCRLLCDVHNAGQGKGLVLYFNFLLNPNPSWS